MKKVGGIYATADFVRFAVQTCIIVFTAHGVFMKTCLTIAGSDPSGGAGVQADLKTFAANRVYGMSVITALTAQNTMGVQDVYRIPPEFVSKQLKSVFSDIYPCAVKIGMQGDPESIKVISDTLMEYGVKNVVVDPVMVSTSGAELINNDSYTALCGYLLPLADIITPNIPEAQRLTGMTIASGKEMLDAAVMLREKYECNVLIKGGHGDFCNTFNECDIDDMYVMDNKRFSTDLLLFIEDDKPVYLCAKRFDNPNSHGTGCTLSSAIAAGLAKGYDMRDAVRSAKEYVTGAIKAGLDLGRGRGPLDHIYLYDKDKDIKGDQL